MLEWDGSRAAGNVTEKRLSQLLQGMGARMVLGDVPVHGISYRSEETRTGDAFFCIPGLRQDGHDFAPEAISRGAVALVVERQLDLDVPQAVVGSTRAALAAAASRFWGKPTEHLTVVGVTGTNGKTTSTYLLDAIFRAAGKLTGMIGTVETRIGDERLASAHTTPESADLQSLFARMHAERVTHVAMEVSSHAIDLHRVDGVHFAAAAFTNLTQDHLDYHGSLEVYWTVKKRLFTELDVAERIINIDDPKGAELAAELGECWTVGRSEAARIRAVDEQATPVSTTFTLETPFGSRRLLLPLAGAYNVSNALVASASALACGISLDEVVAGLCHAPQVPGRLEMIDAGQPFTVLVDYAHTPDSLTKAVAAAREATPGRVITVFGCGGDRDPDKRSLMGIAAGEGSDEVIVTSDNPRTEDPMTIIEAIVPGLVQTGVSYTVEPDRRVAIRRAVKTAAAGDTVLIAGKGHEDYQIFGTTKTHFDDREVAREELNELC